jgi:hypothetical protein
MTLSQLPTVAVAASLRRRADASPAALGWNGDAAPLLHGYAS